MNKLDKNVEARSWNEFRNTGLFMFINTILHAFGWAFVVKVDKNNITEVYPARVRFRGFQEADQTEMHGRIAKYLEEVGPNLVEEIK